MVELERRWQEYFYDEELNISIPIIKKGCRWIFLNVPDLSFLTGWKRRVAGIGFFVVILYFTGLMLLGEITILSYLLRTAVITSVALVLYIRTIAYMSLKYIEAYQRKAKSILK